MHLGTRIAVVGTSGAGKTTFAARLAALLDCLHIELDGPHLDVVRLRHPREARRLLSAAGAAA